MFEQICKYCCTFVPEMKRNAAFIQILFSLGRLLGVVIACVMMAGCQQKSKVEMTPWGTPVGGEADTIPTGFTLSDIQANGELIMLTLSFISAVASLSLGTPPKIASLPTLSVYCSATIIRLGLNHPYT